jgi:hypothetical protein
LIEAAGPDGSVIIISDHGFRPRKKMMAYLRPDDLLEAMGHLTWAEGEEKVIDFSRTRAFSGQRDTYNPVIGFSINVSGRQPEGIVQPESQHVVAKQIAGELRELKVEETGDPLFLSVEVAAEFEGDRKDKEAFDIYVEQAATVRTNGSGRTLVIAGERFLLDEFLTPKPDNSGNHAPKGVFVGSGPAFRETNVFPLIADSPYTDVLNYVTGYMPRLEGLYRVGRTFGGLDPYTTIDITPTILYLLGLPNSTEMDGVLMERVLSKELLKRRSINTIESYDFIKSPIVQDIEVEDPEETLEQLRALGYIQ